MNITMNPATRTIEIGRNFVDAVSGKHISKGDLRLMEGGDYTWKSTLHEKVSVRALRDLCKKEGKELYSVSGRLI